MSPKKKRMLKKHKEIGGKRLKFSQLSRYTNKTDIWNLGLVLFRIVTGYNIFADKSVDVGSPKDVIEYLN